MAAAVTLSSATLENQLPELIEKIKMKQMDQSKNPDGINTITAFNTNDLTNRTTVTLAWDNVDVIDSTDGSIDTLAKEVYAD